jgi:serine/threonine protein kinase
VGGVVPPELIAGRYRVQREVGRGGMGSVWLCHDERLGREVALKLVGGLPGESSIHLARALREARHSAALSHPNVVAIFDALEEGDQVWLVMEYVPSRTLDQIVREDGPMDPRPAACIGADVADGLAAAHELGTVHRDVKPSNVLVRADDGRALIADFGIARTVGQEQLTRSGLVTGTPTYFAPELARGQEPSPASDVWALGVTLYVAVEGEAPYADQANAIAVLNTIASTPPPEPTRAGPLTTALHRMLDADPETRWSMARSAAALREVAVSPVLPPVDDPAPPAVDPTPPAADPAATQVRGTRTPRTVPTPAPVPVPAAGAQQRRRPALLALGALVVLVMLVGAGWWLTRAPNQDAGAADPGGDASGQRSTRPKDSGVQSSGSSGSGQRSPKASPSAASSSSTLVPVGVDAGSPSELVAYYYELLPEDTGAAWQLLTPELRDDIEEGTFEGFWATVDDVDVDDVDYVGEGVVQVTLTYTTDGRSEQETRRLGVERVGDDYLISEDQGVV